MAYSIFYVVPKIKIHFSNLGLASESGICLHDLKDDLLMAEYSVLNTLIVCLINVGNMYHPLYRHAPLHMWGDQNAVYNTIV